MKPTPEKRELTLPPSVEQSVPVIHEVIAQLRHAFPLLSIESIGNILGLPEHDADVLIHAAIKNAEVKR